MCEQKPSGRYARILEGIQQRNKAEPHSPVSTMSPERRAWVEARADVVRNSKPGDVEDRLRAVDARFKSEFPHLNI